MARGGRLWRVVLMMLAANGCAAPVARSTEPVRLWFGGDVHLGDGALPAALPFIGAGAVNLEGPLGEGVSSAERLLNTSVSSLGAAGVRVAWVENNHADDEGEAGRARTRDALKAAEVAAAGISVLELGGQRVVFMGVDLQKGAFGADFDVARALGDVLVVGFHVTAPALLLPAPELEVAVPLALSHGATVVVAHGTHAVARVERREGAVIAWGLGNLQFACSCTTERDGLVLEVELEGRGRPGATWVVPVTAGLNGAVAKLSEQPDLVFQLLESLGSSPLAREGPRARF
jgi:poly-gamma-glutamate synthesis protein (capsule biosynthesis protein)